MIFIHSKDVNQVDPYIDEGKCVFILVYMEGCGPCMVTKPEWLKIESMIDNKYKNNDSIVVADINKDFLSSLKYVGDVDGFPTMKYICKKNGNLVVEPYEKERNVKALVQWIESKINNGQMMGGSSSPYHVLRRLTKKSNKKRTNKTKKSNKKRTNKKKRKSKKRKPYK